MPLEVITAVGILFLFTGLIWTLGWHYGAKSLIDRNKAFLKEMKTFNRGRSPKSDYMQGFDAGQAIVLNAFERFLERFQEDPNDTT